MTERKELIGWYSSKQQKARESDVNIIYPYVYYKRMNGEIVQVSGVLYSESEKSLWDDAFCVGRLKEFHKATKWPLPSLLMNNK